MLSIDVLINTESGLGKVRDRVSSSPARPVSALQFQAPEALTGLWDAGASDSERFVPCVCPQPLRKMEVVGQVPGAVPPSARPSLSPSCSLLGPNAGPLPSRRGSSCLGDLSGSPSDSEAESTLEMTGGRCSSGPGPPNPC